MQPEGFHWLSAKPLGLWAALNFICFCVVISIFPFFITKLLGTVSLFLIFLCLSLIFISSFDNLPVSGRLLVGGFASALLFMCWEFNLNNYYVSPVAIDKRDYYDAKTAFSVWLSNRKDLDHYYGETHRRRIRSSWSPPQAGESSRAAIRP